MKNRIVALFLLLNISTFLLGQDIKVGTPYKVVDAQSKYYFNKGNQIITIKIDKLDFTIQKMNAANLTEQNRKVYNDFPKGFVVEKVKQIQDRVFIFYSLWDKENEYEQLFYREVDFDRCALKESKKLITVKGKITGRLTRTGRWHYETVDKFDFQYSKDESKMLISYRHKPEIRNDDISYDIIGLEVFNQDLDLLWKKDVKMPYTEKKMNNLDYSVDGAGNAYVLAKVYKDDSTDDKKTKGGKEANYDIELLKYESETARLVKTRIAIKDKFIETIWIFETSKDYMVCSGFYNNGNSSSNVNGVFIFKVDKDRGRTSAYNYEIPVEILNQYASKRTIKKNKKKEEKDKAEFKDLVLKRMISYEDGSVLLIGEQEFVVSHTYTDGYGNMRTTYKYYNNDILLTKIDSDGRMLWMRKLPKRQMSNKRSEQLSYKYMRGKGCSYFIFLDNKKNIDLTQSEVPSFHVAGQGGYLTAYKVTDMQGDVSKISILDLRDVQGKEVYQFTPKRILPVSDSDFVLEIYKKKKEDELIRVHLR